MRRGEIEVGRSGPVTRLHLNRPAKRNAMTAAMYADMADAIEAAAGDGTAAIIVSGEGGTFCAGNDLADFVSNRPEGEQAPAHRFLRAIAGTPVILIAAVQGRAIGVGTTMLLHCDFVLAEPDAVLQMPFVDLALVPEAASSLLVPRLVGHVRAAELLLLGEPVAADRAASLGFVTRVTAAGQALAEAEAIAARLAAKPASALRRTKLLLKSSTQDVGTRMTEENLAFAEQLKTPELAASVARFFASRTGHAA